MNSKNILLFVMFLAAILSACNPTVKNCVAETIYDKDILIEDIKRS